jgi:acetolactate synthase I/II/III large subunit
VKLSDYIADFLAREGVSHVFGLTGGAVAHLFDSVAAHPKLTAIFAHHEQAAAFAAQADARVRNNLGACFVTTGPGGTNALTGTTAAWLDSVPCLFLSGQVRLAHTGRGHPVRQVGVQHLDILSMVRPITKYAVLIEDPRAIKYHLQKAVWLARHGRPGPVWIDLPLDLQWAEIDPDTLPGFSPEELPEKQLPVASAELVAQCARLLAAARRPLIVAGYGVRLSHAESELRTLVEKLQIPFLTTWNVSDLFSADEPLNTGRPGMFGQRGANLAMQNCDLLLAIGSHLCVSITGTMFDAFARDAKIVMVDVDPVELAHRTVRVDLPIPSDARVFLESLLQHTASARPLAINPWRERCALYKSRYNALPAEWRAQTHCVHSHVFVEELSRALTAEDVIVVDGGGTINQTVFQAFQPKQGQRLIISSGLCSMGSGLPESVGASFATDRKRRTLCLSGDGSLQLNIQELQTLVHHQLPVKIFVLCNDGYTSIRQTQDGFLGGRHIGSERSGGVSLPDYGAVARAYGLATARIASHAELREKLPAVLATPGPVLCEIIASKDQPPLPRQGFDRRPDGTSAARPFEDMFPHLDRAEFREIMITEPLPVSR